MDNPTAKTCSGCGERKPLTGFGRDAQKKDGLTSRCRSCRGAAAKQYAQTDAGRAVQRRAVAHYAQRHPERVKEFTTAWRAKNPGYSAEANRRWREENPDGASAYYQANREASRQRYLKRRAIKKAATVGPVDVEQLWAESDGTCGICHHPIDRTIKGPDPMTASIDHIVPLSRGGKHEQANLQWAHLVCNKRKGARVPAH